MVSVYNYACGIVQVHTSTTNCLFHHVHCLQEQPRTGTCYRLSHQEGTISSVKHTVTKTAVLSFFTDWAIIFVDTTRSCSKWVDTLCLPYGGSVVQVPTSTIISCCVTYAWFSISSDIQLQHQAARCCIHQNQLSRETHLSVCILSSPFLWPW